ncbi:MAG: glycosyltransferase family 2 protein [bacterium]|nr:glycosyltransferase family 2 protein [bacterium]
MIDILIINYNTVLPLAALLDALTRWEKPIYSRRAEYQITVVDNGSLDGSVEMVAHRFPQVRILARPTNGGYAVAVNEGIAATKQSEILILNSDILIPPDAVARLVRIWERLDCHGIVAPLHLEEDNFPQLTWGVFPSWRAEWRRKRLERGLARRQEWARQAVLAECCATRQVDWVSGSCLFFPRTLAEAVGPWDPRFFLYFEDIDWCLRARRAGYAIYHTAEVQVRHCHGASMRSAPVRAELEYRRSQCYFTQKYYGRWRLRLIQVYLSGKLMGRWIRGKGSGFRRKDSWKIIKHLWRRPGEE